MVCIFRSSRQPTHPEIYPGAVQRSSSRPDWHRAAGTDARRSLAAAKRQQEAVRITGVAVEAANHEYVIQASGGYRAQDALLAVSWGFAFRVAFDWITLFVELVAAPGSGYAVCIEVPFRCAGALFHVTVGAATLWFAYGVLTAYVFLVLFLFARQLAPTFGPNGLWCCQVVGTSCTGAHPGEMGLRRMRGPGSARVHRKGTTGLLAGAWGIHYTQQGGC